MEESEAMNSEMEEGEGGREEGRKRAYGGGGGGGGRGMCMTRRESRHGRCWFLYERDRERDMR